MQVAVTTCAPVRVAKVARRFGRYPYVLIIDTATDGFRGPWITNAGAQEIPPEERRGSTTLSKDRVG